MAGYERPEPALRSSRESDPTVEFQIDARYRSGEQ
jgi:hypothetical protein